MIALTDALTAGILDTTAVRKKRKRTSVYAINSYLTVVFPLFLLGTDVSSSFLQFVVNPVSLGVRPERRKKWTVNTTVSKEEKGRTTNTILEFN